MRSAYKNLFSPITINHMTLKNRVIALAGVSAQTVKMFGGVTAAEQIAKGGASMVVTCMADVDDPKSNFYPGSLYTLRKSERDKIRSYVRRIHQYGAKYMLEIDHVGEYYRAEEGDTSYGTTTKVNEKGIHVKQMDNADMERLVQAFAKTTMDAVDLGFDALLFDCAGGWLMSQYISPFYNHRTDEYGGSIQNRAKFPLMVLKSIRQATGPDFPIMLGLSANEYFEVGSTPFEDIIALVQMMEPDIDGVIVGCGNDQTRLQMTKGVSTNLERFCMNEDYCRQLKEACGVPIVLTNGVMSPELAENALSSGSADMVGLCRPLIADYDWVEKAATNRAEDIRPCLRCNQCFHVATDCRYVACTVNPYYTQMEEQYVTPVGPSDTPKHVVVVGGGPAGLYAALAADACGHRVTLLERENELGGRLCAIRHEAHKKEIAQFLVYLRGQVAKSSIEVRLSCTATKELVEGLNPDKVIVAVGAEERCPAGVVLDASCRVLTATEAILALPEAEVNGPAPNRVVIIGGGTVGVEIALEYAERTGCHVDVIEQTGELARTANGIYRPALLDRVEKQGNISSYTGASVVEASAGAVTILQEDARISLPADTVVISVGLRPRYEEAAEFFGITEDTVTVGDCNRSGNIVDATFEGHCAGVNV